MHKRRTDQSPDPNHREQTFLTSATCLGCSTEGCKSRHLETWQEKSTLQKHALFVIFVLVILCLARITNAKSSNHIIISNLIRVIMQDNVKQNPT